MNKVTKKIKTHSGINYRPSHNNFTAYQEKSSTRILPYMAYSEYGLLWFFLLSLQNLLCNNISVMSD